MNTHIVTMEHYQTAHLVTQLIWMTINYGFCCETETQSHLHIATIFIQTAFYMSDVLPAAHPTVSISKHSRYTIEQWQEVTHNPLNGVIVEDLEWNFRKGMYTWYSASSWIITSEALRYGTCSWGISQFYLHTHMFNLQSEWVIPSFCLPNYVAGTHLPTPEGWKAELSWPGWVVT